MNWPWINLLFLTATTPNFECNWMGWTRVFATINAFPYKISTPKIAAIKPLDWHRQQQKNSVEIRWIFFLHRNQRKNNYRNSVSNVLWICLIFFLTLCHTNRYRWNQIQIRFVRFDSIQFCSVSNLLIAQLENYQFGINSMATNTQNSLSIRNEKEKSANSLQSQTLLARKQENWHVTSHSSLNVICLTVCFFSLSRSFIGACTCSSESHDFSNDTEGSMRKHTHT